MRIPRIKQLLSTALGLIVLGSLWFWFAPAPLGGSSTYVVTKGISMEPHFHTGDLALVRSQSSYHVGEVVAYQNKMLHTIVLHRIVGREGARYVFKGDNNSFLDPERPLASQLVGSLWLHLPGVGATLQSIRSPLLIGALAAIGILLVSGVAFTGRRRRRRERRAEGGIAPALPRSSRGPAAPTRGVLAFGAVVLLPFVVLALVAFTRGTTTRHPYTVSYRQSGTLSYSAQATPGPTYPSGEAVTGEPLFAHVLDAVAVSFAYHFHAAGRHALEGSASLDALVDSTNGWRTMLQLAPATRFHGSRALVTGTLQLTSLLALIHSVETATKASGSYTLTLLPRISARGGVNGVPLHATFAPKIQFSLTPIEAQPALSGGGSLTASAPTGEQQAELSMFAPSAGGSVTGARSQPASLSLGLGQLSVANARTSARDAIAIILCALLAALACLRLVPAFVAPRSRDEAASIRARYGRMIVPVARVWQLPGVPVIDVADMEALARIAEHYDRSILHETVDEGEAFWVTDESGQFRYAIGAWASAVDEFVEEGPVDDLAGVENLAGDVYADHELDLGGPTSVYEPLTDDVDVSGDSAATEEWSAVRRSGSGRDRTGRPRRPRLV